MNINPVNAIQTMLSTMQVAKPVVITKPAEPGFFDLAANALKDVSADQSKAAKAEADYSAGVPGATLGEALVASDRAEVDWNATVAVRDEAVSAYSSLMNMQF